MTVLIVLLRLLHILSGVFWVGAAIFSTFILGPTVSATGDAGRTFMDYLVSKARINVRMSGAAGVTVLAGAVLYWIDSGGFTSSWTTSGPGLGFGIGALFALAGMGIGALVGTNAKKIGQVAARAQGKPSAAQLAEMQTAQDSMAQASLWSSVLLVISLICMATARYWVF